MCLIVCYYALRIWWGKFDLLLALNVLWFLSSAFGHWVCSDQTTKTNGNQHMNDIGDDIELNRNCQNQTSLSNRTDSSNRLLTVLKCRRRKKSRRRSVHFGTNEEFRFVDNRTRRFDQQNDIRIRFKSSTQKKKNSICIFCHFSLALFVNLDFLCRSMWTNFISNRKNRRICHQFRCVAWQCWAVAVNWYQIELGRMLNGGHFRTQQSNKPKINSFAYIYTIGDYSFQSVRWPSIRRAPKGKQ